MTRVQQALLETRVLLALLVQEILDHQETQGFLVHLAPLVKEDGAEMEINVFLGRRDTKDYLEILEAVAILVHLALQDLPWVVLKESLGIQVNQEVQVFVGLQEIQALQDHLAREVHLETLGQEATLVFLGIKALLVYQVTLDTAQALLVLMDPEVFLDHQDAKGNLRLGMLFINPVLLAQLVALDIKAHLGTLGPRDHQALQVRPVLKDHVASVRQGCQVSPDAKGRKGERDFLVQMADLEIQATKVSLVCPAEVLKPILRAS